MSYVTAKMHHNRFLRGLFPDPAIASLQRSPDPVAGDIRGPTSKPPIKKFLAPPLSFLHFTCENVGYLLACCRQDVGPAATAPR